MYETQRGRLEHADLRKDVIYIYIYIYTRICMYIYVYIDSIIIADTSKIC